jgi:hypothetical protein
MMPKYHTFRSHAEDCNDENCKGLEKCIFNLPSCRVCNCYDGCLTSECPGEKITKGFVSAVRDGRMDYTNEKGWHIKLVPLPEEQIIQFISEEVREHELQS